MSALPPGEEAKTKEQLFRPTQALLMPTKEQLLVDFQAFDFDGNGLISADELLAILSRDGGDWDLKTAEFMLKSISKKADKDGDGQVSIEELAEAFADEEKV